MDGTHPRRDHTDPYFWPGWISVAAVVLLAAARRELETWLAAYLACMAASGRPAFAAPGADAAPVKHGPVLYLAGENALTEEQRRCQLLKAGLELPDDLPIRSSKRGPEPQRREGLRRRDRRGQAAAPRAHRARQCHRPLGTRAGERQYRGPRLHEDAHPPARPEHGATVLLIGH